MSREIIAADMIVELIKYKVDRAKTLEEARRVVDEIYSIIKEKKIKAIMDQLAILH